MPGFARNLHFRLGEPISIQVMPGVVWANVGGEDNFYLGWSLAFQDAAHLKAFGSQLVDFAEELLLTDHPEIPQPQKEGGADLGAQVETGAATPSLSLTPAQVAEVGDRLGGA